MLMLDVSRVMLAWQAHDLLGHSLASLYAIRPAPPTGMARLGEHTGCTECDDVAQTKGTRCPPTN